MIERLKERFEQNPRRHQGICWAEIQPRLTEEKLLILQRMEETGGEPDVIGRDGDRILYADCAAETPAGRRGVCFDEAARAARKKNPPEESAERQAQAIGVTLMNEEQYRHLQTLGAFDLKTSSWIATPPAIRVLGGALFCERRYDTVFVFHNGADSYYSVRGWRGVLRV